MFRKSLFTWGFLAIAVLIWLLLLFHSPRAKPVRVVIKPGTSAREIAYLLARKRVISSPLLFAVLAKSKRVEGKILPGKYLFKEGMSSPEALEVLEIGPPKKRVFKVIIPEGFTIDEIGKRLASRTPIDREAFQKLAQNGKQIFSRYPFLEGMPTPSLEGYLFPKTYIFNENITPAKFIELSLEQFQKEISSLDFSSAQQRGFSLHALVTTASLIEKEAKIPEERGLISAVIYNRLQSGMPLEIDATIQYALPQRKPRLNQEDLKVASPYNTYLNAGLPPGPISNPGLESLKAALNPAPVDYLYYVLTDPASGKHSFTRSYQEFLRLKRQAKNVMSNGK